MSNLKEKNNIIIAIKECNISKLESYIEKNGVTINVWSIMFYMPLIDIIKELIKSNATIDFIKSVINIIKENRNNIVKLIKNNNIDELKNFIEHNNISLKELKNEDFDILICSIENEASDKMIKFIINQYQYKTFNYFINKKNLLLDKGDTPLFYSISKNNFHLASFLLENGADINYNQGIILCHLTEDDYLNKKNLKYVLCHNFKLEYIDRFVIFLIQHHSNANSYLPDSLKIIFNHYLYDNNFILNLLTIYNNKTLLSNKQLNNLLIEEKNKIYIKEEWYKEAVKHEFYDNVNTISDLFNIDNRDKEALLYKIEKYYEEIYNSSTNENTI